MDEAYIGRAHWHSVPSAGLKMLEIKGRDRAIYRCRVDFHVSPTRNYKIALDVIGKSIFLWYKTVNKFTDHLIEAIATLLEQEEKQVRSGG